MSNLEWQLRGALYLAAGLAVVLPLLLLPKNWLKRVSQVPGFSANAQTIWRMPVVWLGYALFFGFNIHFWGFMLATFGLAMDRVDGKTAKAMKEMEAEARKKGLEHELKLLHNEKVGKVTDPLADKLTFLPPFVVFAAQGIVSWWFVISLMTFEMLSTLMREPFNLFRSRQKTDEELKDRATGVGKLKVTVQFITLLVCAPLTLSWTHFSLYVPNALLAGNVILCFLSIRSRMLPQGKSKELSKKLTSVFSHE